MRIIIILMRIISASFAFSLLLVNVSCQVSAFFIHLSLDIAAFPGSDSKKPLEKELCHMDDEKDITRVLPFPSLLTPLLSHIQRLRTQPVKQPQEITPEQQQEPALMPREQRPDPPSPSVATTPQQQTGPQQGSGEPVVITGDDKESLRFLNPRVSCVQKLFFLSSIFLCPSSSPRSSIISSSIIMHTHILKKSLLFLSFVLLLLIPALIYHHHAHTTDQRPTR